MGRRNEPTPRCCAQCYHYGFFLTGDPSIDNLPLRERFHPRNMRCELTGSTKKRPRNYTNCKSFGYVDVVTGEKVAG